MDVVKSCEYEEHLKIESIMTKLPTDRDRNPVFQNEKWQITNAIIKYITTDFIECFDSNFVCSLVCYAKNDSHVGNVITNFEAPLKLFLYSIFFLLIAGNQNNL